MLIYFMAIWNILRTFGISYDPLVHFLFIGCIFPVLGAFLATFFRFLDLAPRRNLATLHLRLSFERQTKVSTIRRGKKEVRIIYVYAPK
jgi:hypothetical protein